MFSRNVNDTPLVIRMPIVGETITWSITYDHHSDNSSGVIYDRNIFIIQATGQVSWYVWTLQPYYS